MRSLTSLPSAAEATADLKRVKPTSGDLNGARTALSARGHPSARKLADKAVRAVASSSGVSCELLWTPSASRRFMESEHLQNSDVSWGHEPGLRKSLDCRQTTFRFMESLHDFSVAHWDREPPLTRPSATLSPSDGEREGVRGRFMERPGVKGRSAFSQRTAFAFIDILAAMCVVAQIANAAAEAVATYTNPVLAGDYPDPSIIRVGKDYWATATSSEWGPQFPILHSRDLVNWKIVGAVFPKRPAWAVANFWAPEISEYQGRYFVYYVGRKKDGPLSVAVAAADMAEGHYTDHGPLVSQEAGSIAPIA